MQLLHMQGKCKSEIDFVMCPLSSRRWEQVECVILQEGDLCVGRNHCDSTLPLWLPLWYWSMLFILVTPAAVWSFNTHYTPSIYWLWNLLGIQVLGLDGSQYMCVAISIIGALVHTGHTVKRVMWFRVSAEGRREFVHHSDPNQVSLSYRGRTRYEQPYGLFFYHRWILTDNIKIYPPKKLSLPATQEAATPAARCRSGWWSWAMQGTITSGLRQTNRSVDGRPLTPSDWKWQVSAHRLKLPSHLP